MPSLILALLSSVPLLELAVRSPSQTTPLPKAEELLARLEADLGTPEARAKVKNLVIHGTIVVQGLHGQGTMEEIYAGDRGRWNIALPGCAESTQGTTGAFSWSSDPVLGISIREGDEQQVVVRQLAIGRSASWRSLYARAETIGARKVDGHDVVEIRMIPARGKPEVWAVDPATARLVYADQEVPDPLGGSISVRSWLSEWKVVGGVRYPYVRKLQFGAPGFAAEGEYPMVVTVSSIEQPAEIAPERVAPSADVLAAYADPSKRAARAPDKSGECVRTELAPQPVASVRVEVREADLEQNLAVILPEVMGYLGSLGADIAGPPFARYHRIAGGAIDLEAGFPVAKRFEGRGRIQSGELPGGDVAVTWHIGPYDEVAKSQGVLEAWMRAQGLASRGGPWHTYWTDPGIEPDPAKWRTQIIWPVKAPL